MAVFLPHPAMPATHTPLNTVTRRVMRWLPVLILLGGAGLTWLQFEAFSQRESRERIARIELHTGELVAALERRLAANEVLLRGVAGLFASSDRVDEQEFRTFVAGMNPARNYPGIRYVGFVRWMPPGISEPALPDAPHPLGSREAYSSIVFIEPLTVINRSLLGQDMMTDPDARSAMQRAADTGQTVMTETARLAREPGFMLFTPLYRGGTDLTTPEQRRAAFIGWAYAPLQVEVMLDNLLASEFRSLGQRLSLWLYTDKGTLLHGPASSSAAASPYTAERVTDNFGQEWRLLVSPLPEYWSGETGIPTSRWIGLTGTTLTGLLALTAWLLVRNHLRVGGLLDATLRANRRLAESEAALRLAGAVMEVSPIGIVVTDAQRRIVSVNPAFTRITGYGAEEVIGQDPHMLASGRHDDGFYRTMWLQIDRTGIWEGELLNRRKAGDEYAQMLSISRVRDATGQVVNYVGMFQDVTERREAEDRIRYLAHHDHLTGLPNRAHFLSQASQELASAKRYGRRLAVLFIDLDRFKPINDTHGHEAGDAVLIGVAKRLKHLLRESDLVCRQGGDEFVVLTPEYRDTEGLKELAHKLCDTIAAPYEVGDLRLSLSASIGIATYPEHGQSLDALIQNADAAMYLAKSDPSERVRLAQPAAPPA